MQSLVNHHGQMDILVLDKNQERVKLKERGNNQEEKGKWKEMSGIKKQM